MKFKAVPEPRAAEFIHEARHALPLVPGSENDCCARLLDRTELEERETARDWITFLRALGLAERTDESYRRVRGEFDRTDLARAFRERVFGADAVLDVLSRDEPLDGETIFERVRETVPNWERHRRTDWKTDWRERTRRLLDWAVEFELAEHTSEGYRAA